MMLWLRRSGVHRLAFGRQLSAMLIAGAAAGAVVVGATPSAPLIDLPLIDLQADPLLAHGMAAPPTLTLALSIDRAAAGAAHAGPSRELDDSFDVQREYLGYFDPLGCYAYADDSRAHPTQPGQRIGAHFRRISDTLNGTRLCSNEFSGNFLNWATASSLDILRMGLTGGLRDVDSAQLTIVRRAYLPDGTQPGQPSFYDSDEFPTKRLRADQARGALPTAAITGHDIYIANCRDKVYLRATRSGTCDAGPATPQQGSYAVRVAVCDAADARSRERSLPGYCQRYDGSGHHKPVGALQRHAHALRVAVFGDPVSGRVLRAPMAFIGEHTDQAGIEPNPLLEWNPADGTLVRNPRHASDGVSGAIQAINNIGEAQGTYPHATTTAALYRESLRYLRGLPPTAGTALPDGASIWADPHPAQPGASDHACIKNHLLAIGNVPRTAEHTPTVDAPDTTDTVAASGWAEVVSGFESGIARHYIDGRGVPRHTHQPPNPEPMPGFAPQALQGPSDFTGLAYWAHTHDIRPAGSSGNRARPGMRVTTLVLDLNAQGKQTAFELRRRNPLYLAAKYGGFIDASGTDQGSPFALSPADESRQPRPDRNHNWQRIEAPGEPRTYVLAGDARQMLQRLDAMLHRLSHEAAGMAKGVAVDATRVSEAQAIFQAWFDADGWHGDLVRRAAASAPEGATSDTNPDINNRRAVVWRAAERLNARDPASRRIVVGTRTPDGGSTALDFNARNLASLDGHPLTEQQINHLRGDRSLEQPRGPLRARRSVMGDIINSGVLYLGQPTAAINASGYADFRRQHLARTPVVFAGANDGMLHAFRADNGDELFGYIPSWLVPQLHHLTSPGYTHRSYVDAPPTVAEANTGSENAPAWRTVLIGGTGAGGQGVYALDVSDPAAGFSPAHVLWEFTDADDPDLGHIVGRVRVLKLKVNHTHRWFAVVGSGVNNHANDGHASTHGDPAIFLLDLSKTAGERWSLNHNYFKIILPKADTTRAAGVLNLSASTDASRTATALYAGDLHGQLWRIDLDTLATPRAPHAQRLFVAQRNGEPQAISSAPALFRSNGAIVAVFGTGQLLEPRDHTRPFTAQSVYAILDDRSTSNTLNRPLNRTDLRAIEMQSDHWAGHHDNGAMPDTAPALHAGWYADFVDGDATGERLLGPILALPGRIVFNTLIPASGRCGDARSAAYTLSLLSGEGTRATSAEALSDPLALDSDATTEATRNRSSINTPPLIIKTCSAQTCTDRALNTPRQLHRLSWREIANHNELKQRAP